MLRRVNFKAVFRAAAKKGYKGSSFYSFEARAFSQSKNNGDHDIDIPSEKDRSFGRDRQDVEAKEEGADAYFNSDPIVPPSDAGTRENPIMVPSAYEERQVGYEDPNTHQLVWFNLNRGSLHYVPDIGLYFKMEIIDSTKVEN